MTGRSLRVQFTRGSARQVNEAAPWWGENRPTAPQAVVEELARALVVIAFWHAHRGPAPRV